MAECYLDILAKTIRINWEQSALTDFYLTEDGTAQDTSRGNHYTYGEMYAEIVRVADLLTHLGLQKGDHIAICGANSAHWVIAYLAIAKMQGVSVTVMHTLQPDEIARLVDFSDAKALFTDKELWVELQGQSLSQVQSIIALESWEILRGKKVKILNRKSLIDNQECGFPHSKPDSLAMVSFTSGTTGIPKGVMLSEHNLSSNVNFLLREFTECPMTNTLSLLPMAHAGIFVSDILHLLCRGTHIHILSARAISHIFVSYSLIKPQEVVMVPMMLLKLIDSMKPAANDETLNSKVKNAFGGGLEMFCLGGAKLPIELEKQLLDANLKYAIGYGTTECGPFISLAMPSYVRIGSVGKVSPTLNCKIALNGEILVKGENVMLGYYKDPEATAQKIDKDGWLHTGDKGHLDEDGYLYVEGRLEQDMIVLPNGENIRPDNIESLINALPEVSESLVLARDGKLVAIIVPSSLPFSEESEVGSLRRSILRTVNPQLPLFSQLYDVEITDVPLQRTEKQTLKRYLYK